MDMENKPIKEPRFVEELLELVHGSLPEKEFLDKLSDYHENDIAEAIEQLAPEERKRLYPLLGAEKLSEIFAYIEDVDLYIKELDLEDVAEIVSCMDSDDAADVLEELDDTDHKRLVSLMDDEAERDVRLILSYDEDEIGSCMTTNYIVIRNSLTIKQAMSELVRQAGDNDNISTIYVIDEKDIYCGAIDLKDLIIAREHQNLESLIISSYPYVTDHEKVSDCIERIKDYAEDSIPILSEGGNILGIITAQDIVEVVDDELGDDYAKLAGMSAEADLKETTCESMKKRLPWLIVLLFLAMGVSSVVGMFETVVAFLPVVICFQSLILGMAGNVGTQSLAVTIRVLMGENLTAKQKLGLILKEMRVGLANGMFLGSVAFLFVGFYTYTFKINIAADAFMISGCVSAALMLAMTISSMVGTFVPMFFNRINVDPAVASGPLITTINDLVAVVTYYGLAWIFLINIAHIRM